MKRFIIPLIIMMSLTSTVAWRCQRSSDEQHYRRVLEVLHGLASALKQATLVKRQLAEECTRLPDGSTKCLIDEEEFKAITIALLDASHAAYVLTNVINDSRWQKDQTIVRAEFYALRNAVRNLKPDRLHIKNEVARQRFNAIVIAVEASISTIEAYLLEGPK